MFQQIRQLLVTIGQKIFRYGLNDPTTPDLAKAVPLPNQEKHLPFTVAGFNQNDDTDVSRQAAGCYITIANSTNYVQWLMDDPINKWAAVRRLPVHPRAGQMLNAYYDRRGLKFFYEINPDTGKFFYTADSQDVVSHELGHALLDAMRPDFWSTQAVEIWAFHEAFGDCNAILSIMLHDEMLERAINETGGDLMKSNVISRLAEQMGQVIYSLTGGQGGYSPYSLRDATNNFNYTIPERLPAEAPDDKLASECHSFGRVFMGVWYEMLVAIYQVEKQDRDCLDALRKARDASGKYLLHAITHSPRTVRYYHAVCLAMLAAAAGTPHKSAMEAVFRKRNMLPTGVRGAVSAKFKIGKNDDVFEKEDVVTVKRAKSRTIKLSEHMGRKTSMIVEGQDLYNTNLDVPADEYYFLNGEGKVTHIIAPTDAEIVKTAKVCAKEVSKSIGGGKDTMWEIKNGDLKRTYVCNRPGCHCHRSE